MDTAAGDQLARDTAEPEQVDELDEADEPRLWAPWSPKQADEEQQRLAAERACSAFAGCFGLKPVDPAQRQRERIADTEREQLKRGQYPKASMFHTKPLKRATPGMREAVAARRDPGVRRKPTRAGRTPRPAARTSSRATRAGPDDDPDEPPGVALALELSAPISRAWLELHEEVARG
jgi:hypothetical protein